LKLKGTAHETLPHDVPLDRDVNPCTSFLGGALPPYNLGGQKESKILRDLKQLSTLNANISGVDGAVDKQ